MRSVDKKNTLKDENCMKCCPSWLIFDQIKKKLKSYLLILDRM